MKSPKKDKAQQEIHDDNIIQGGGKLIVAKTQKELLSKINKLITKEIRIAQKENQPTSRLTSLSMEISKLYKYEK
jgi:hypothetical protein